MALRLVTDRHISEVDAAIHGEFFLFNVGNDRLLLVDKRHSDFEKYRTMAIANAERLEDYQRIEKYKAY